MPKHEVTNLETTAQVIAALGGHSRVATMTGRTYKQVWDWGESGAFPARYFLEMWLELVGRGFSASPALWGQSLSRNKEALMTILMRKARAAA